MSYSSREVVIPFAEQNLEGFLNLPKNPEGLIIFVHGSGSGRFSPRNQFVADLLCKGNMATLLFDLLTKDEERIDSITAHLRFDIQFLAERVVAVTEWVKKQPSLANLPLGYFGASTGAAAALVATAQTPHTIHSIVSRGGRPDLAGAALSKIQAPTLLIIGGNDYDVIKLNEQALSKMRNCKAEIQIVKGATHLFEEPGKLEEADNLAKTWFKNCFHSARPSVALPDQ
eukprot:TRINITY_DN459_c0_g2_i2.p1 TRINITY_DN459_c0_g2~~TRINITY_DN459_c0_g2_i2.p1  ORF type:complete len:229 (+),score=33.77 TRINITY_DN459_c0_g2_i2:289-975(+)